MLFTKKTIFATIFFVTLISTASESKILDTKKYHWNASKKNCEAEAEVEFPISGPSGIVDAIQKQILHIYDVSKIDDIKKTYGNKKNLKCDEVKGDWRSTSIQQNSNYATVFSSQALDLGGAHQEHGIQNITYLADNGQAIETWRDLFLPDSFQVLKLINDFADDSFRECVEEYDGSMSEIGLNSDGPYLIDNKIIFGWNEYEIASYACSYMSVEIPIEAARPYIKPDMYARIMGVQSQNVKSQQQNSRSVETKTVNNKQNSFTDPRDGQTYAITTIEGQTWMAENLRYDLGNKKLFNGMVYNASRPPFVNPFYSWAGAMKACPAGWHLPSKDEWNTLFKNVDGAENAGALLKGKTNPPPKQDESTNGIDFVNFNGLLTGYFLQDVYGDMADFDKIGEAGFYWTSTETGSSNAFTVILQAASEGVFLANNFTTGYEDDVQYMFSVRCIKDEGNYSNAQSYNKNQDNFAPATKTATQKKTYVSDDDDEYENDDYDYTPTAKSVGKKNSYADDEDIDYVAANADSEPKDDTPPVTLDEFYETPLHWGLHLAIGYAGTWKNEEVVGMFDPYSYQYSMADPFKGFMGINADIGLVVNYHLTNMYSLVGELNVRILEYFKESEVWYLSLGYYGTAPLDENMLLVDLSVPLLFRVNPRPNFYLEAGLQLNLNVYGAFTLSNEEYDYEEDMGEWKGQSNGWGIVLGAGVTLPLKTIFADIGGRIVLDMTRLEADQMVYNGASNTFRMPTATRAWAIQFTINTYL